MAVEENASSSAAVDMEELKALLSFQYPYAEATRTPSKQTATQKKGRVKDQEAQENAKDPEPFTRTWRSATFMGEKKQGTAFGNAMHALMQYISFDACTSAAAVREQADLLCAQGFLTKEQADMVDTKKIAAFFDTPIGRKLRQSKEVLREFKFSILEDASAYGEGLEGEKVLLQGVVDCALVEEDGITIVDFKTDYITEETLKEVSDRYAVQVCTYADALSRIFEKPVIGKALYFFRLNRFIWL